MSSYVYWLFLSQPSTIGAHFSCVLFLSASGAEQAIVNAPRGSSSSILSEGLGWAQCSEKSPEPQFCDFFEQLLLCFLIYEAAYERYSMRGVFARQELLNLKARSGQNCEISALFSVVLSFEQLQHLTESLHHLKATLSILHYV